MNVQERQYIAAAGKAAIFVIFKLPWEKLSQMYPPVENYSKLITLEKL
jgi:hypothetical protein